ncbi:hypothetical protein SDC9_48675 [bioreactor metagenome]|uniref:Uncharacterized protein n=1 Tax=bioreactor metagenome TaxID=1076179 RepID=A0A644WF00_9ZZZZ
MLAEIEEGLPGEVLRRQDLARGERMILRQHADHVADEYRLACGAVAFEQALGHAQIEDLRRHLGPQRWLFMRMNREMQGLRRFQASLDHPRDDRFRIGRNAGDAETRGIMAADRRGGAPDLVKPDERAQHDLVQQQRLFRRRQALAEPQEQVEPQPRLDLAQLAAERRLRTAQFHGSGGETLVDHHRIENVDLALIQLHSAPPHRHAYRK